MYKISILLLLLVLPLNYSSADDKVYHLFPDLENWVEEQPYEVFVPDNLWDFINGAAESYLAYNFKDLHIVEYSRDGTTIRAEIYRHKNPANAFGIYSQERSPDFNFIDLETQGYLEGSSLNFYKKDFYVKIYAETKDPSSISAMKEIAGGISDNIGKASGIPPVFDRFPKEHQVSYGNHFVARNFLGHDFLNQAYTADYEKGGESFRLFIMQKDSPSECEEILNQYFEFTKQDKNLIQQGKIIIKDPYNGNLYIKWDENEITGVMNTRNEDLTNEYLEKLQN